MINEFRGKYFFLSNFFSAPVCYRGNKYLNNEAAFQAQKTQNQEERLQFINIGPADAKKLGRKVSLRSDWEKNKYNIMYEICLAKFTQNEILGKSLLDTDNKHLEEGNTWGDREWGTVDGVGDNNLGKILMRVREELRKKKERKDMR